jgi:hypothetical protein
VPRREKRTRTSLNSFLESWGPKRNLLRNRVFRLTVTSGDEVLRGGGLRRVYRQPGAAGSDTYGLRRVIWRGEVTPVR